jgi:hypothetical protein
LNEALALLIEELRPAEGGDAENDGLALCPNFSSFAVPSSQMKTVTSRRHGTAAAPASAASPDRP